MLQRRKLSSVGSCFVITVETHITELPSLLFRIKLN